MQRSIMIGGCAFEIASDDDYLTGMPPHFEPDMVALFSALVTPAMTVADVGANIGMTALLFSGLAAHVHAFEPSPSTFAFLETNLRAAGVTNVEAWKLGMGEVKSRSIITFSERNRSGGFVSQTTRPVQGHVSEEIEISTLDDFFRDHQPLPDFIKIDVEGFEPHVIKGGRGILYARRPTVVLELNHFCLQILQRITLPDFFDLLRSVFPVLIAVDQGNRTMANLHDPEAAYSVMAQHVLQFRFPNIVAGFDPHLHVQLQRLAAGAAGVHEPGEGVPRNQVEQTAGVAEPSAGIAMTEQA